MAKLGYFLFILAILLSLVGVFILYESSTYTAQLSIGDKYYFFKNQSVWLILGTIGCFIVSFIDYRRYYKIALPLLLFTLFLLIVVFLPGVGLELKGAHRWINLGFTILQPSEILKITLAIYLAAWLSIKEKGRFLAFMMLLGLSLVLVIFEPDMGTAMVVSGTAIIVYFLSGAPSRDMGLIGLLMVVAVVGLILVAPYRLARLTAFQNFDPHDLSTTSYHVKQVLLAVGSGGITGVGFGNSIQKYAYLPESTTDSIFAIFAEEGGFVGCTVLIGLFLLLFYVGFAIAFETNDMFGKLLGAGVITFLAVQVFVNIGSQVVLIPLTGVPLPFISYGGSSLIINLVAIGILMSIAKYGNKTQKVKMRKL
ncbi:MAG TPA: putative peptidoglycan glycosyltransferase FtsW [Patescibacteria group bacterium]|nr:putative peptidoglycan glycosyltransferase FtsW [Patescibacteria group bacterium]